MNPVLTELISVSSSPAPSLCPSAPLGLPRLARHPASAAGPAPGQYVLSPALFPVLTYIIPSLLPSLHLALCTRCILSSLVLSTYSSCRIFFVLSSQKLLLLLFFPSRPHVRSLLHPSIFPSPFTGTSAIVLFFFFAHFHGVSAFLALIVRLLCRTKL